MTDIPTYKVAVVGQPGNAGMVNQFLGAHDAALIYSSSVLQSSQTTGSAVYTTTAGQYVSQSFTTTSSQTQVGQIWLQVSVVNGSAISDNVGPLMVSIYADFAGRPTGSPLATTSLSETIIYASSFWVVFPIAASGLSPGTTYHIVTSPIGDSTHYYVWQRSNQTSGASTTSDFLTWTDQAYGLMYQVYDQTANSDGLLNYIILDGGSRWVKYTYNTDRLISTVTEYVIDQTGTGNFTTTHTLSYTNARLTGIS